MSKISIPTLVIGGLVVLILVANICTFQVSFYETVIKVRFGQADENRVIDGRKNPGLKLRWPWPIESIRRYDTRLQTLDTPETEVKTRDQKNVIIGAYAVWRISDPLRFFRRVKTLPEAERQMRERIRQIQASVIGQSLLSDFVNLDRAHVDANYDRMLLAMKDGVASGLEDDYGIQVEEIGIRRVSLPKETTQQVFESMRQERNKIATRYREEGRSQAQAIVARAESEAKAILAFAERLAAETRSAGIAAARRIFAQIEDEDRDFFLWLRRLDALRAMFAQQTTIFLDQGDQTGLWETFVNPPVADTPEPQ